MDDVAPRRSGRKRTASSRLQDMLCARQITKTRVDRCSADADGKIAKTETKSLVELRRTICGSDGKKDGKDGSTCSPVPAEGDNDLVGTAGNLQNDTSMCSTNVTVEIQPCNFAKQYGQGIRIQISTGDHLQSENNQIGIESHEQEQGIVVHEQEPIERDVEWLQEQVQEERLVKQGKEQERKKEEDDQSEQVMKENIQVTQEMSAEEEDELVEEGVDEGYLEVLVKQERREVKQVEQLTEQEVEQVEEPRVEQNQVEEQVNQENIIRNTPADIDSTDVCHSDFGASVKDSHLYKYVIAPEETGESEMKTFTDEDDHERSAEEAKLCVLEQPCNVPKPTNAAHQSGEAAKMDDTFHIGSNTNTTDQTSLIHFEQGEVRDSVVCAQYNVTDEGNAAMVGSTNAQESTEELARSPSALGDGIVDATTYLEFASAVRLISNVLQRSSNSHDNVAGATTTLSNESKMETAGSSINTTDASVALSAGAGGGDFNQTVSVQQTDDGNQDAEFLSSEPAVVSQDMVVQPTEKVSVCVVHLPSESTDQPLDRSVIINVIQMPGGSPSGDTDSPAEDATGDTATADPEVDEGGLDMTEARVVMEPSMTCVDGTFTCGICAYTTDKKANWYKHKVHHTGRRPYACDKCAYSATTSSNLRRHQLIHDEVRSFLCTICDVTFRQKIHLERHIKYKHQEKSVGCPHCDYQCASVNPDLKVHMQRRHQIGLDQPAAPMRCADCGFTTTSRKDLRQHEKFHKSGPELKLYCEQCCFVTDCQSRLKRHLLTHTRERPFSCELCGYRATQKEHVARHMRAKHDAELDKTENQRIREQNRLTLSSHDGGSGSVDDVSEEPVPESAIVPVESYLKRRVPQTDFCNKEKLFACNFCTMSFAKLINLYKHVRVQHGNTAEATDGLHACVVCEYRSTSRNNLLVHMRKHNSMASGDAPSPHKLYSCVVCQFLHPHRQTLYEHMRKQHNMQIIVSRGSVHCLIDADKSGCDPDKNPKSIQDTELLQLASNSDADATPNDGSYEGTNAVEKLQAMARMIEDDNIPTEDVALHDGVTVPTDNDDATIDHDEATIDHDDATIDHNDAKLDHDGATIDHKVEATTDVVKMCTDELSHLSSGDFVEINGEMYKVEFSNKK